MTSLISWQNSVSLCLASLCTPRPNLPVTPGVSRLPTFAFQSPMMKRTYFSGVNFGCYSLDYWSIVKGYNKSDFGVGHVVMSMYRVISCVVGKGYLL